MNDKHASRCKRTIHELISRLSVSTPVAYVIKFDCTEGPHGRRIAEKKIDVLLIDAVGVADVVASVGYEKDVSHTNLRTDHRLLADHLLQNS